MEVSLDNVLVHADTLVIGNGDPEFRGVLERLRQGQVVLDLVRVTDTHREGGNYHGICW